jgi:plastocyanin
MKRLLLLPVLASLVLVTTSPLSAATKTVSITSAGFVPSTITIAQGDSVTWTNADTRNRQPASKNAPFTAPVLKPGESFTFTFKDDGKFAITDELVKGQRGSVTVTKATTPVGAPSLKASRAKTIYGGSVVLSGVVPSAKPGEKVTLRADMVLPTGAHRRSVVAEMATTTAGAFSFTHVPRAQTAYTVVWQATPATAPASPAVTVLVAPRIGFGVVRKLTLRRVVFSTKATSAIPYAGRSVYIQRRNSFGQWVSLKRVVLKSNTLATRATLRLPSGVSRMRVLMPKAQAGTGYVVGVSRTISIIR